MAVNTYHFAFFIFKKFSNKGPALMNSVATVHDETGLFSAFKSGGVEG